MILPARGGANIFGRKIARSGVQPAGQNRVDSQPRGILREFHKHRLGYILGRVRLTGHAKRGGVNEINMSADEFAERGFGAVARVVAQELLVG